jgi:predicted aspartyl protease
MIVGVVSAARDAVVTVRVVGPAGGRRAVTAVIDTGFDGHLTLPPGEVAAAGLPWVLDDDIALADGSVVRLPVHLGRVEWHGAIRDVLMYAADSTLFIDCKPGGRVEIAPAP